jgi:DNA polymerase III subunit delta'
MSNFPESDRLADFVHPRENTALIGHEAAESQMLEMISAGKLHHAWIVSGPKGIGKATFAYRLARFLFAHNGKVPDGTTNLHIDKSHPVFRRVQSGGHADLLTLRRPYDEKTKKIKRDLTVEEMRRIGPFFGKKAAEGGWRIAIIDTADDMNIAAANAVLKTLEEPPNNSLILLIANAPGRLLPTIRSRCQSLQLQPLCADHIFEAIRGVQAGDPMALKDSEIEAVAGLSNGSVGRALELALGDGFVHYQALLELVCELPKLDIRKLEALAGKFAGVKGAPAWPIFQGIFLDLLCRLARIAATADVGEEIIPGEGARLLAVSNRISAPALVELWENARNLFDRTDAVNLDRRHAIMSTFYEIEAALQSAA